MAPGQIPLEAKIKNVSLEYKPEGATYTKNEI